MSAGGAVIEPASSPNVVQETRIRPCLMTIATTVFGLLPIFWATGRGADVMKPMAIPSIGGMAVSVITLFIVPCVFCAVEEWKWIRSQRALPTASGAA